MNEVLKKLEEEKENVENVKKGAKKKVEKAVEEMNEVLRKLEEKVEEKVEEMEEEEEEVGWPEKLSSPPRKKRRVDRLNVPSPPSPRAWRAR